MVTEKEQLLVIEKQVRHKLANELTKLNFWQMEVNQALMQKDIEYMKQGQDKTNRMLEDFIDTVNSTFATKEEHKQNVEEIKVLKLDSLSSKKFMWQVMAIVSAIVPIVTFLLQQLYKNIWN